MIGRLLHALLRVLLFPLVRQRAAAAARAEQAEQAELAEAARAAAALAHAQEQAYRRGAADMAEVLERVQGRARLILVVSSVPSGVRHGLIAVARDTARGGGALAACSCGWIQVADSDREAGLAHLEHVIRSNKADRRRSN